MAASTGTGNMDIIYCPRVMEPNCKEEFARLIEAERLAGRYFNISHEESPVTFTEVHERDTKRLVPGDEKVSSQEITVGAKRSATEGADTGRHRHLRIVPEVA